MKTISERANSIGLLIAGCIALRLLLAATTPLFPQEAYYWTWSRDLDWSYFDHPPLATFGIALTTAVLGSTAFGIKLAAVLWSLGWNLLWARLILDMFADRRLAFWSIAALNLTFLYEAYALAPTPDGPLLFAWVGTIWAIWRLSEGGDPRWWFAAGAFLGLACLAKYSGALLGPIVLLYLVTSPRQRRWFLKPQPYLAILLAAAIFAPVLIWNAQHDWVSLAFQSTRRVEAMSGLKPHYFLVLVATQFLILTPYVFVIAIGALLRSAREWFTAAMDNRTRLLLISGALPIALCIVLSFRSIVKINWLIPAYWSLAILGVHHLLARENGLRNLIRGLASSAVILLAAGAAVAVPNLPVPEDMNIWSGWAEAAARVEKALAAARAEGMAVFVFSPNYKISSLIRFYLPGHPRTYAQDIYGEKALQFDYFPLTSAMTGATGILVLSDQSQSRLDLERLRTHFDACRKVDAIEAMAFGKVTRRVEVYSCPNYRGHPRQAGKPQPG